MAVSLNAVVGFNSTANRTVPRMGTGVPILKINHFSSPSKVFIWSRPTEVKKGRAFLLVANVDRLATETSDKSSEDSESSFSNDQPLASSETEPHNESSEASNGSAVASDSEQGMTNTDVKPTPKRSRLTARERLKAARVLNRYPELKPTKKQPLGTNVLEALRESDKISGKKRSGLPEAPTNLFDDSKRGMPKEGLTFELPVGWDVFLIIVSVVLISTVMFTTTYIVWKAGAIHFNEY